MSEKKYSLTKNESDRVGNILNVARIQEEIMNSITLSYKTFITQVVFKRLEIDPVEFKNSAIDLQTGEMIVKKLPTPPKPPIKKVVLKGK